MPGTISLRGYSCYSPYIAQTLELSTEVTADPTMWRMKQMTTENVNCLVTAILALSYSTIWIERCV